MNFIDHLDKWLVLRRDSFCPNRNKRKVFNAEHVAVHNLANKLRFVDDYQIRVTRQLNKAKHTEESKRDAYQFKSVCLGVVLYAARLVSSSVKLNLSKNLHGHDGVVGSADRQTRR